MQWASLDRGLAQRRLGFPSFFRMKSFHLEVSVHSSSSGHGMGTPTKVKKSYLPALCLCYEVQNYVLVLSPFLFTYRWLVHF
jgi:hypothetical protein